MRARVVLVVFAAVITALVVGFALSGRFVSDAPLRALDDRGRPVAGGALSFEATSYCKGTVTAAGVAVRGGIAAADPAVLPIGTVLQVDAPLEQFSGIWTVLDTGPEVKGRELDLYTWSCHDALAFGRRRVRVTVLRLGWDPNESAATVARPVRGRPRRPTLTDRDTSTDAPAPAADDARPSRRPE